VQQIKKSLARNAKAKRLIESYLLVSHMELNRYPQVQDAVVARPAHVLDVLIEHLIKI
jgi:hypothetical protein